MRRRYLVLGLAIVAALLLVLTPVGAAPVDVAKKALRLAKEADKRSKSADARSRRALRLAREEGPPGLPGAQGAPGPPGATGPQGPGPSGAAPVEPAQPVDAGQGQGNVTLASIPFTYSDGKAHRVLLTGGFNAVCNPCAADLRSTFRVRLADPATVLVQRTLSPITGAERTAGTLSEIVVTPATCSPCTYELQLNVPASGGGADTISASGIRLGLADLGPVG